MTYWYVVWEASLGDRRVFKGASKYNCEGHLLSDKNVEKLHEKIARQISLSSGEVGLGPLTITFFQRILGNDVLDVFGKSEALEEE